MSSLRVSGVGLNDSPAGLASYLIEKFSTGTNPSYKSREDGGFLEKYTYDELIDNLMMYWASNSITTAMRIYAEMFTKENLVLGDLINSYVYNDHPEQQSYCTMILVMSCKY